METKIVYEVKELLEMFPFSKAHWYREMGKENGVPCIQIGKRKAVCAWYIDELIAIATTQNLKDRSSEDALQPDTKLRRG